MFIKPLLSQGFENIETAISNLSFRRNYKLFLPYYQSIKKIDTTIDGAFSLVIGTESPLVTLTVITNPLCKTCNEVHHTYQKLLKKFPDELKIDFRFFVLHEDRNDPRTQVSERFLELYDTEQSDYFIKSFDEWYEIKNTEKWLKKWGKCHDLKYNKILDKHRAWCFKHLIDNTPTIFINGKLFPKFYHPTDIENFVEYIIDFEKQYQNKNAIAQ
jgi:hypothetical protein